LLLAHLDISFAAIQPHDLSQNTSSERRRFKCVDGARIPNKLRSDDREKADMTSNVEDRITVFQMSVEKREGRRLITGFVISAPPGRELYRLTTDVPRHALLKRYDIEHFIAYFLNYFHYAGNLM
jgi:hypothetical protein